MNIIGRIALFLRRIAVVTGFIVSLAACWNNSRGDHDVDLAAAVWLRAEPVPTVVDNEGVPADSNSGETPPPVDDLFTLPPGKSVRASALGGAIDPTGTTIVNDFDGDGILNANETTTGVWVADYPMIEAVVATPVTLKVKIDVSTSGSSDEVTSQITSDDMESNKTFGSEKIHQTELNLRTVQFQDTHSGSASTAGSHATETNVGYSVQIPLIGGGFGVNYGYKTSSSWSNANSWSNTETQWADRPFKNNLDRDAWSVKSDTASRLARKYRGEMNTKTNQTSKIDANAGYVRAPLYIKNLSVNMPVHISNVLCSLMFEKPNGELVPVQSFRLRNDDYSLFEIDVYGGTEFGPYVIELNGLNTAEVQNAIALGYSPKIFIVDYQMTHVADSNYRSMLLNFSGDNLKIVEENAKGRTAQVKLFGPGLREMFRVAAFSTDQTGDVCSQKTASLMAPGVSLREALDRISCSGMNVEYEDYVFDLSEVVPALGESRLHIRGIKSINGIETFIPCNQTSYTGSDGVTRQACVQKPVSEWTEDEKRRSGVWAIYSNGKYYAHTEYWKDGADYRIFDPVQGPKASHMAKGVDSIIWAGDYYDIVYISFKDFLIKEKTYGRNPLESQTPISVTTAWDGPSLESSGLRPYDPDNRSTYLGEAGFGEKIELKIKLEGTTYLDPDFGVPTTFAGSSYFSDFTYGRQPSTRRFSIDEAADFEINMGFGGERTDWLHVVRDITTTGDATKLVNCGRSLDYVNQTYTLCFQLPTDHPYVDEDVSLIKLYVRPALNSAYRRTIWPLRYSDVRKYRGELAHPIETGDLSIYLTGATGTIGLGDDLYINGDSTPYTITALPQTQPNGTVLIQLGSTVRKKAVKTTEVYVKGSLTRPEIELVVDSGFVNDWNTDVSAAPPASYETSSKVYLSTGAPNCSASPFHAAGCLGFLENLDAINWMGAYNEGVAAWNDWVDGGMFSDFLSGGLPRLQASTGKAMYLNSRSYDYGISDHTGTTAIGSPIAVKGGDRALVLWLRSGVIYGRFIRLVDGVALTNTMTVSTATVTGKVEASGDGSKAIVAYESGTTIYAVTFDLVNMLQLGSTNTVATIDMGSLSCAPLGGPGCDDTELQVAVAGNRGIVTYRNRLTASGPECVSLYGRIIDVQTGAFDSSAFNIAAAAYCPRGVDAYGWRYSLYESAHRITAVGNNRVAVVSRGTDILVDTGDHYLTSTASLFALDLNSRVWTTPISWSPVITTDELPMRELGIVGSANRAIVYWIEPFGGGLKMVGLNSLTGASPSSVVQIDSVTSGTSVNLHSTAHDGIGLLTYQKGNTIYVRSLNMDNGQLLHTNTLEVATTSATNRVLGQPALYGQNGLIVWESFDGVNRTIRGRSVKVVPTGSFSTVGASDMAISLSHYGNSQTGPYALMNGSNVMTVWNSQDESVNPQIRGFSFDLTNATPLRFGLNNFFVAPLIERDYTIQARIKN